MKVMLRTSDIYLRRSWSIEDIKKCIRIANNCGLKTYVINQSKESIEIGLAGYRFNMIQYYLRSFKYDNKGFVKHFKRIIELISE